jgi:DNA-directed RNA polymerase subunit RPC12/RpoP
MKLTEKMSYLKGYIDGIDFDTASKEGKILANVIDVMHDMVAYIEDLQGQVDELTELCEILDEDLGSVEDDFYDDDEDDFDDDFDDDDDDCDLFDDDDFDDDDDLYEVVCPTCGDSILLDGGMLDEGSMACPNCGEDLEFDLDDLVIEDIEDILEAEYIEQDI